MMRGRSPADRSPGKLPTLRRRRALAAAAGLVAVAAAVIASWTLGLTSLGIAVAALANLTVIVSLTTVTSSWIGRVEARRDAIELELTGARRECSERAAFLTAIVARSDDAIVGIGLDGTIQSWNGGAERLFLYRTDEALGRPITIAVVPDQFAELEAALKTVLTDGTVQQLEMMRVRPRQEPVNVSSTMSPTRDLANRVIGASLVARDITTRKQGEAALRAASLFNRQIIHSVSDGLAVYDRNLRFVVFNPAMERLTGRSHRDIAGAHPAELANSDWNTRPLRGVLERALAGESMHREAVAPDEFLIPTIHWVDDSYVPLRTEDGAIIGVIASVRDVTERRQREVEIGRINRLYSALSQINQTIVHAESHERLLQDVCRVLVDFGGFQSALLGWHDPQRRMLVPEAWSGGDGDFLRTLQVSTDERGADNASSAAMAFRYGRSCVCDDLLSDPAPPPWQSAAVGMGIRASASFPIRLHGEVRATLTVYAHQIGSFLEREIGLLEEAAVDVSFALDNLSRAEERQRREDQLAKILDTSPGLILSFRQRPDGSVAMPFVSPRLTEIFGADLRAEDLAKDASPVFARMHPDDLAAVREEVAESARTLRPAKIEFRIQHPDRGLVWALSHFMPSREPDGGTLWHGIIVDITERKEAEVLLAESSRRLNQAQQVGKIGDWQMDVPSGRVTWSETMVQLFGCQPPPSFDALMDLCIPEDRRRLAESINLAATTGKSWELDLHVRLPGGSAAFLYTVGRTLTDAGGHVVTLYGIVQDITERQSLQAQLRQAQKMEAVGQLAGGVAHDFNNVLTAILGYSRFLADGLTDPVQLRDVGEILKAGERAAGLTRQLLAFSRRRALESTRLDVNLVVDELVPMLRRMIGAHIDLVTTLEPAIDGVLADRGQIEQVVMNLVVNASDAMPYGGRIRIETANIELGADYAIDHVPTLPGSYVMLAVSDTGEGMSAETRSHLFEPFFTTKPAGKGTGLGLATVYGIVKQTSGYVWVYSELGRGSTFKAYLPIDRAVPVAAAVEAAEPAAAGGDETVLVVEDEAPVRFLVKTILERAGYHVLEAPGSKEAESIFHECGGAIAALVTDVVMPGGTGIDLHTKLALDRTPLPVLFMSGYTGDAAIDQAHLLPDATFLQKPFVADGLLRKLREVLDR